MTARATQSERITVILIPKAKGDLGRKPIGRDVIAQSSRTGHAGLVRLLEAPEGQVVLLAPPAGRGQQVSGASSHVGQSQVGQASKLLSSTDAAEGKDHHV